MTGARCVGDLGEQALLEMIGKALPLPHGDEVWAGDDTAVVGAPSARMLFCTDAMTEGVDFETSYASGADVAWKVLAINASDIAAMGGRPLHAVTTLLMPPATPMKFFEEFLSGLREAASSMDVALVGGDLGGASEITALVSMTGELAGRAILRSGALVGDLVCVTGSLGGSAAGLGLLQAQPGSVVEADPNDPSDASYAIARHLRPWPRIEEGRKLAELGATAMIDISDGLLVDLYRLMRASDTGCEVDPAVVPLDVPVHQLQELISDAPAPLELATRGGEDFELLFTLPESALDAARRAFVEMDCTLSVLGTVTDGPIRFGEDVLETAEGLGWDHLHSR